MFIKNLDILTIIFNYIPKKLNIIVLLFDVCENFQDIILSSKKLINSTNNICKLFEISHINNIRDEAISKMMKILIKKGYDKHRVPYLTALMLTALCGYSKCVKLLIENGCNINTKDIKGWNALMYATVNGHEECIKLLIKKKCNINEYNCIVLVIASEKGHTECVKLLIESGCDVNATKAHNKTALMYAAENGYEKCVKLLIENGCDVDAKTKYEETALMYAASNGHIECVKLLIEKGCYINAKNNDKKQH